MINKRKWVIVIVIILSIFLFVFYVYKINVNLRGYINMMINKIEGKILDLKF